MPIFYKSLGYMRSGAMKPAAAPKYSLRLRRAENDTGSIAVKLEVNQFARWLNRGENTSARLVILKLLKTGR